MPRILICAEESNEIKKLASGLSGADSHFSFVSPEDDIVLRVSEAVPDLIIMAISDALSARRVEDFSQEIKSRMSLPVMVLVPGEALLSLNMNFSADDFVVLPCGEREFALRVKRLLYGNGLAPDEVVRGGDLIIDAARCEVSLDGQRIDLTYREYELLKFLMSNKGRVFTRETLLNRVWGYDYYGGDRTVDVHIRRLRSKIELSDKGFIETVRNIGYRFRDDI